MSEDLCKAELVDQIRRLHERILHLEALRDESRGAPALARRVIVAGRDRVEKAPG
jgi:hypothetical protein